MARRLPVLLVATAVAVAALGRLDGGGGSPGATAPAAVAASVPDPTGALPLGALAPGEIVALWSARAAAHPADYLSRTHLANALMAEARETGDQSLYVRAEVAAREALALNPRYPPTLLALAAARAGRHDFSAARDLAARVLAENPGRLGALATLGDAHFELGEYERAAEAYGRLATRERSAPVVARLARLAFVDGRPTAAVALAREAAALADGAGVTGTAAAYYRVQLAHVLHATGDATGAVAELEAALRVAPGHLGARELLARVHAAHARLADATALYESLLEDAPAADLHGSLADVRRAAGDHRAAAAHERAAMTLAARAASRSPAERRHLARFYATRDPTVAVALARADLATRRDVYAWDTLAWALYHRGSFAEAAEASERALARGTRDPELLYHAGMIRAATGDHGGARELLSAALGIDPRFGLVDAPVAARTLRALGG